MTIKNRLDVIIGLILVTISATTFIQESFTFNGFSPVVLNAGLLIMNIFVTVVGVCGIVLVVKSIRL